MDIPHTIVQIIFASLQISQVVICIWIGVLIFRRRGMAGWMALSGAVLQPLPILALWMIPLVLNRMDASYRQSLNVFPLYQACGFASGLSLLTFLLGVFFHVTRQRSEAGRISELEAIIQDRP